MKKLIVVLLVIAALSASSCKEKVKLEDGKEYKCIGIEEVDKDPNVVYKIDTGNMIIAVVFFETIIVPIIIIQDLIKCPIHLAK